MITLIFTTALIALTIWMLYLIFDSSTEYVAIKIILFVFCFIYLLLHIYVMSTKTLRYGHFEAKHTAVRESLLYSRLNRQDHENTAIILEVININKELAEIKYMNTLWFNGMYISDKYNDLPYIR